MARFSLVQEEFGRAARGEAGVGLTETPESWREFHR